MHLIVHYLLSIVRFTFTQVSEIFSRILSAKSWLRFLPSFRGDDALIGRPPWVVLPERGFVALREPFARLVFVRFGM